MPHIVTKKTTEQFFKGSIGVTGGVRNNYGVITPSVVYKKGILNFKSEIQYLQNDQISTDVITRNDLNGNYIQDFENNSKTIQKYANSRLGLKFSEKSDLTLIGYIGSYNTKGNIVGTFINNSETGDYANLNKTINNDLEIASVYNHKINEKKTFSFKNKYAVISDFYSSEYTNQVINYFDIKSKIKEFASSLSYDIEDLKFLKKPTTIDYNLKYINRNYSFSDTDFYVNQNVFNATFEMNNDWSKKISTKFSFTFEHSNNKSDTFLKNYNLLACVQSFN